MTKERRRNLRAFGKLERVSCAGKETTKGIAAAGRMESEVHFWDLSYWKVLHTPHSLDAMHIMKKVTESLLGSLMNMPERTKDGQKARTDRNCLA
jgi:hypothetical protein